MFLGPQPSLGVRENFLEEMGIELRVKESIGVN